MTYICKHVALKSVAPGWLNQPPPAIIRVNGVPGIQKLAIKRGLKSGKVQINRVEHPKVEKEIEDKATGTISYKTITPHIIEYFASGGPDRLEPLKVAEVRGGSINFILDFEPDNPYYHVQPFLQGLSFLGWKVMGDNRSVNRFNKDSATWTNVYHAWFRNAVDNNITRCWIEGVDKYKNQTNSWSEVVNVHINGMSIIRFINGSRIHSSYSWEYDKTAKRAGGLTDRRINAPKITVYEKLFPQFEVMTDTGWYRPRKLTQQKLYEAAMEEQLDGEWKLNKFNFVNVVTDKYQFGKIDLIKNSLTNGDLVHNASRSRYKDTVHLILRRFKKKR